jgi:hypothetical protein
MLRWKGSGWIPGVPARDLSEEEAKKFGKLRLIGSGLYEQVKEKKIKEVQHDRYQETS